MILSFFSPSWPSHSSGRIILGKLHGENWPHWRGPLGSGVSPEQGLPVRWGPGENILWKAPLQGLGVSSPVVWEHKIFLTSQLGCGPVRPGNHPTLSRGEERSERALGADLEQPPAEEDRVVFLVQAFGRDNGSRLWEVRIPTEGFLPEVHHNTNLAIPSCVTDGEGVYCWFGNGQLVALSLEGEILWQRHLGKQYSPFEIAWGHSSSPVLYEDSLILLCDHEPAAYLLALDKSTGAQRWKVDRDRGLRSYSTPLVVRSGGRDELIVNSSEGLDAYDPATGTPLWFFKEPNRFPVPSPSHGDGLIFTSRGYRSGPYLALQPGGRGDISTTHVRWHVPTGAPYVSSVVYYDGLVYMVSEAGIATCVDGKTGEPLWRLRVGGLFSASPVAADGKVYLTSEGGEVIVLRTGRQGEILARNDLQERCLASPAISAGRIYIRTDRHLYRIGTP